MITNLILVASLPVASLPGGEMAKIERLYQARFTQEVELAAWYDI